MPLSIGDPFLYLESGGRRAVVTTTLVDARLVVAVEPGLTVRSVGGTRVQGLLVVIDKGSENLTDGVPYDLAL